MKRSISLLLSLFISLTVFSQSELTVKKIMQDPKSWVGTSPQNPWWSEDGTVLYFNWNPEKNPDDSLYSVSAPWTSPKKVSMTTQRKMVPRFGVYNKSRRYKLYTRNSDIYLYDLKKKSESRLTLTSARENNLSFAGQEDQWITFMRDNNLFRMNLDGSGVRQLTNFVDKKGRDRDQKLSEQDEWLKEDQLEIIEVLKEEKEERDMRKEFRDQFEEEEDLPEIPLNGYQLLSAELSPDGKFVSYSVFKRVDSKNTIVPDYVTESGYTEDLRARAKVGSPLSDRKAGIYSIETGESHLIQTEELPGIKDAPDYYQDYNRELEEAREVYVQSPLWSPDGKYLVVTIRSKDNKDRWIGTVLPGTGEFNLLDRQTDQAWIAGPGIGWSFSNGEFGWLPDSQHIYYQSEESGYSHLYIQNIQTGKKTQLTSGEYEVYSPRISADKKKWFFVSNKEHPGIRNLYEMPLMGGEMKQITSMGGGVSAVFSPDDSKVALIHGLSNRPDELFVIENLKRNSAPKRITNSQTEEWNTYDWRKPEFITFTARDEQEVHARLYQPEEENSNGAGVIFVHGAGYLQNAHQWWSSYFREYMFHNLLVDMGYTVLDIDYRGSAGYGRDWRTGIYRHMGGLDLADQVDGARFMVDSLGLDASRLGIYGGSYGGFITLMAMFTEPGTFNAGAALRSVTDWAHYNHGYTSNILNTPVLDSVAYRKSSPIYFAEGLEGSLLICHGMVDTNVHFQDVVRLAQRLIELGKENWEFAVYPKESHGFTYPSSWTDEYSRILKLFEENLN